MFSFLLSSFSFYFHLLSHFFSFTTNPHHLFTHTHTHWEHSASILRIVSHIIFIRLWNSRPTVIIFCTGPPIALLLLCGKDGWAYCRCVMLEVFVLSTIRSNTNVFIFSLLSVFCKWMLLYFHDLYGEVTLLFLFWLGVFQKYDSCNVHLEYNIKFERC